jgi:alpha-amylase/alpha-mannosidase (GH57 family)
VTRVRVATLWHMHQPLYRDPIDRSVILPWVRLHALKDYLGMLKLVEDVPGASATFNLVPSLVDQLEAAAGGTSDPWQEVSRKPADSLTPQERAFCSRALFMAHPQQLIGRFPRFAELLQARGPKTDGDSMARATLHFTQQDWTDLQVLGTLAWFDLDWQKHDRTLAGLAAKGRGFSEADKAALFERERALVGSVLPAYRKAAQAGRLELSTSPYYHPILPLLCDTEAHHEACPGAPLPRRFQHPEDAADQIRRAIERHTSVFGQPPVGMWPSEGSLSEQAVLEMARAGLRWTASDEGVLERSAGRPLHRDGQGVAQPLDLLYRAWRRRTSAGDIGLLFRDRALSDLIGFSYASMEPQAAAADLLARLERIGERWAREGLAGDPVVGIMLDGENAWEHYQDGGRVFLRAFYEGLVGSPSLESVSVGAAVAGTQPGELSRVFAGSWIHANFSVWIGHQEDRHAWDLLGDARDVLASTGERVGAEAREAAAEAYRAACGSDWCWWYGEEHSTENDLEFDRLFRRHLQAVYIHLGLEPPAALENTLITARRAAVLQSRPTAPVTPVLDGELSTPLEWVAAGVHRAGSEGTTMHRGPGIVTAIRFGAGGESLHFLVETEGSAAAALQQFEIVIGFPGPTALRYRVLSQAGSVRLCREERTGLGWVGRASRGRVAAGSVLEISLPVAELRAAPDGCFDFRVSVLQGGAEVETHPLAAPLQICLGEVARD